MRFSDTLPYSAFLVRNVPCATQTWHVLHCFLTVWNMILTE